MAGQGHCRPAEVDSHVTATLALIDGLYLHALLHPPQAGPAAAQNSAAQNLVARSVAVWKSVVRETAVQSLVVRNAAARDTLRWFAEGVVGGWSRARR
ncbi:hypothetical protein GCM10022222_27450 [Amycolatopsis ultiminotia]|uniref:Uncharacterized protein n=1 Tax=Amycolatopsis ultiminotia TaxID=543629 RepID=A0ABP6VX32_9PSEU